ncbi:hypothetical protein [Streptomyces albireticuli]|nr:hypothetical protein [Streptomyces albireticuli]MCD9194380.1 hypothetical protein [Streptomyces albireticuli]
MFLGMDVGTGTVAVRDADGARFSECAPYGMAAYVRELTGTERGAGGVTGAVVAVPEDWCAESGCARREALFAELRAVSAPVPRFVPAAVAVLAGTAAAAPVDGPAERLVCDIGPERVGVTLCRVSGVPGAPGPVVEFVDSAAAGTAGVPREAGPAAHALAHRTAGGDLARRAEILLARAVAFPRYREAPLHPAGGPGTSAVTAGEAIDAFAPVADAVRAAGAALRARCSPGPGTPDRVVVTGALAAHPLVPHTMARCLPVPWAAATPGVPEPGAAAAGALLIAEGAARAPEPAPHTLGLPAHEIRRGRLVARRIPLAEAGSPPPLTVTADGAPVVVEIPPGEAFRLLVEVQEYGHGARRALAPPRAAAPPAGRYHVGLHPVRRGFGVLVLRPVGGGEAALVPLGAPAGG